MGFETGNSGNKLFSSVIKIGPECSIEGAFCQFLGERVAPKIFAVISEGYVMSKLEQVPRVKDLLQRIEQLLEEEVWNRSSQDYDVGQVNYKEYHANLGLPVPDWVVPEKFCLTHGDPSVSNTMIREDGSLVLIDPRPPRGFVPSCRETDAARILQSFFGWENSCYGEQFFNYLLPRFWDDKEFRNRALFWCAATTVRIKYLEQSKENPKNNIIKWCNETKQLCFDLIEGIAIILFTDKHKIPFIIDIADYEEVSKYKWSIHHTYVTRWDRTKLTNLLCGKAPIGLVTDHINQNRLDNRRKNIRFVTQGLNTYNSSIPSTNTSGIKGIHPKKTKSGIKWEIYFSVHGKRVWLGLHNTKEEAIIARQEAEKLFYPELYNV